MWLAAIAALVVGGPLGACMFIAAGITHYMKIRQVDAQYAARGEMTPSQKLIDKWLEGRKARGQAKPGDKPAKYGMWRYAWQRWCAMWEVLAEGHKIRHRQYLEQCREAARTGAPKPPRPSLKEQAEAGWQWVVDAIGVPLGKLPSRRKPDPNQAEPTASGYEPIIACDECGATLVDAQGGWQHPPGSACPKDRQNPKPEQPAAGTQPDPQTALPEHPQATEGDPVTYPFRADEARGQVRDMLTNGSRHAANIKSLEGDDEPNNTSPAGGTMTAPTTTQQQSGEVTGLMSAINYADTVAAAHGQHSTGGGEQYRASLGKAEVGDETIASAARAQEASAIAQAAWQEHADKLREQLAAKEVTTSETGKKDFLLAE